MDNQQRRARMVVGLLLLACITMMTLDARHGSSGSPVAPLRTAVGDVLGPVENATASIVRPVTGIPEHFGDVTDLRHQNDALQLQNAQLRTQLRAEQANAQRNTEVDTIGAFADSHGFHVVQAQVVAMGPAQSFSRTVTIDVGTSEGVVPDLTVINANGLVGRVLSSSAHSSTVLLAIDRGSVVGGRLASSLELGFLHGTGDLSGGGHLTFSLIDHQVSPEVGETILTWGSRNGAPYLPGVPVGRVTSVHSTPAELTETATVQPFVDFTALDVVGVITAHGSDSSTQQASGSAGGVR